MEQLKVIGIEEGVLVVATEAGERFALAVDESLRGPLRRAERDAEPRSARPSPREIQSHIRAGLSAQEVAELLGARLEDVQRYERPVLAEREHIVDQALSIPVLMAGDLDPGTQPTPQLRLPGPVGRQQPPLGVGVLTGDPPGDEVRTLHGVPVEQTGDPPGGREPAAQAVLGATGA